MQVKRKTAAPLQNQARFPARAATLTEILGPGNGAGGFAHYQLGGQQPVHGWRFAFFDGGVDRIQNDAHGGVAQGFHRLADGGERGNGKAGGDDVVKADDGAIFGNFYSGASQAADDAEGGHVVEGHDRAESFLVLQEFLGEFQAAFVTGIGIEGIGEIENERGVNFKIDGASERAHTTPARRTVSEHFWTADESDFAMAQRVQVFHGEMRAGFVVHHDGADGAGTQLAANHHRWNIAFFHVGKEVNIHEEPVGDDDERFDGTREKHFEIAFETAALIVHVSENGEIGGLVQGVFDAAEDQRAVGVGDIENHHAYGAIAFGAEEARDDFGAISKFLGGAFDAIFGGGWEVAGQRRVIEDDGDRGGRHAAFLGNVAQGDGCAFNFSTGQEWLRD